MTPADARATYAYPMPVVNDPERGIGMAHHYTGEPGMTLYQFAAIHVFAALIARGESPEVAEMEMVQCLETLIPAL